MKSIVKHYKLNTDGSLRFVGNETYEIKKRPRQPYNPHFIDAETMRKIGEIAYEGRINPDDREV